MIIREFTKTCRTSDYSSNEVFKVSTPELSLERGKITVVTGAGGSGKSTFAKTVCGVLKPDDKKPVTERHLNIGYMPQKCYAFHTSIEKNLLLNAGKRKKAEAKSRARFLMDILNLNCLESSDSAALSGGETARVSFARLLMNKYDILIFDEPTISMDAEIIPTAENLIRQYCAEENCAVLLITSSLAQAKRMADFVFFFDKGTILETGTGQKVLYDPDSPFIRDILNRFQ